MDSMLFPAYLVLDMPSFPGSTVLTDTKATKIRDLRGTNQMSLSRRVKDNSQIYLLWVFIMFSFVQLFSFSIATFVHLSVYLWSEVNLRRRTVFSNVHDHEEKFWNVSYWRKTCFSSLVKANCETAVSS